MPKIDRKSPQEDLLHLTSIACRAKILNFINIYRIMFRITKAILRLRMYRFTFILYVPSSLVADLYSPSHNPNLKVKNDTAELHSL